MFLEKVSVSLNFFQRPRQPPLPRLPLPRPPLHHLSASLDLLMTGPSAGAGNTPSDAADYPYGFVLSFGAPELPLSLNATEVRLAEEAEAEDVVSSFILSAAACATSHTSHGRGRSKIVGSLWRRS